MTDERSGVPQSLFISLSRHEHITTRRSASQMTDTVNNDYTNPEDAATIKARAAQRDTEATKTWRADLWENRQLALNWANTIPISQAGEIIFQHRENNTCWTFTFGVW